MNKQIKKKVTSILERYPKARDNDNLLIAKVLQNLYGTTDMLEVANMTNESICETITRRRRLAQRSNPFLGPTAKVSAGRKRKQKQIEELIGKEII